MMSKIRNVVLVGVGGWALWAHLGIVCAAPVDEHVSNQPLRGLLAAEPLAVGEWITAFAPASLPAQPFLADLNKPTRESKPIRKAEIAELLAADGFSIAEFLASYSLEPKPVPVQEVPNIADRITVLPKTVSHPVIPKVTAIADMSEPAAIATNSVNLLPNAGDNSIKSPLAEKKAPHSIDLARESGRLVVQVHQDHINVVPSSLFFEGLNERIDVEMNLPDATVKKDGESLPKIFIRDNSLVDQAFDLNKSYLTSRKSGTTELYIFWQNKMTIVPIKVGGDFAIPQALVTLNGQAISVQADVDSNPTPMLNAPATLSLDTTEAEAREILEDEQIQEEGQAFVRDHVMPLNKTVHVQLVDDRSQPGLKLLYPIAGAAIKVIGTQFSAPTNATGHASFQDVPGGGRFLIRVSDPDGRYLPVVTEVYAGLGGNEQVVRVSALREKVVSTMAELMATAIDTRLATLCGQVTRSGGEPIGGLEVRLNVNASGPIYLGTVGPDLGRQVTSINGRFCFLNVEPRLAEVDFYDRDQIVGSFSVPMIGGSHSFETFPLDEDSHAITYLAVAPTAHEEVFGEPGRGRALRSLDVVDLVVLGENKLMEYQKEGVLAVPSGSDFFRSRLLALANASEFEPVLYSFDQDVNATVTPLIPRGFMDDIHLALVEAQDQVPISYDQSLGTLLVDFGHPKGSEDQTYNIKVLSSWGQELESGWYYGDSTDSSKAVYFNVEPGVYTVLATTEQGRWVDVDTVVVANETISFSRLGDQYQAKGL